MMNLLALSLMAAAVGPVETTEHGLRVNGRPFFPFGLFCVGWTAEDSPAALADAARLGCNTVHSYWVADVARDTETVRAYLDEAARRGLKVVPTVGDYGTPRRAIEVGAALSGRPSAPDGRPSALSGCPLLQQAMQRMIGPLKDHPALLAWYVWDEPNAEAFAASPEVVRTAADAVKQEDPHHPTFFCFTPWHRLEVIDAYGGCCDILTVDPYVRGPYMGLVPQSVEAARRAAGPGRPVWALLWAAQNAGAEPPTVAETRCATYLALIHGATGLFYYGHRGEPGRQGPTPGHEREGWQRGVGEPELGDLAEAIAQLGAEIRLLTPALLGESPPQRVTVEPADGPIHLREFLLADRPIFLAANASEEPVQAAFHLEREVEAGTVRVMFERRRLEVADRTFQDEFPPLGTHAYEVTDRKPGNGG